MAYQIKQTAEAIQKIKGSKFIGRAYTVYSREEAQDIVRNIESEHKKASHVCWACRIDRNGESLGYSSDAGEPHGSAGPPILSVIERYDLTNILCVVIRYFGGTKLGIGGLIRAYSGIAAETLAMAGRVKHIPKLQLKITAKPHSYSDVLRVLRKYCDSVHPNFSPDQISVEFEITSDKFDELQKDVGQIPTVILTRS